MSKIKVIAVTSHLELIPKLLKADDKEVFCIGETERGGSLYAKASKGPNGHTEECVEYLPPEIAAKFDNRAASRIKEIAKTDLPAVPHIDMSTFYQKVDNWKKEHFKNS